MARITIDARKYFDFGIGTYIQSLTYHLSRIRTHHSFRLLVSPSDRERVSPPRGWQVQSVPYGKYSAGELFLMHRDIAAASTDLFHSPHYTLPFRIPCRSVVTIHDLSHLKLSQYFSAGQRAYAYAMMHHAVHRADKILTVSEATKRDITQAFSVAPEKVIVTQLGLSETFRKIVASGTLKQFRKRYTLEKPFVLFVGNPRPHKGIDVLLEAFQIVLRSFPQVDLVFAGGTIEGNATAQTMHKVRSLGFVSETDLQCAYRSAEMLVLPSFYEGFGLPALEAMSQGTAVVVSNAGALPEIVGDAGLIVAAKNPQALANGMIRLLRDKGLRQGLGRKGRSRAVQFNAEKTARLTMDVYDQVLGTQAEAEKKRPRR